MGVGVSAGTAYLAGVLSQLIGFHGFELRSYDLAGGEGDRLESDASEGKLSLVVEVGLGDYILEIQKCGPSGTSRLTGAISRKVPQVWVLYPGSVSRLLGPDALDIAGRQLAWLASAAIIPPELIVCQGSELVETVAGSFKLWVLPQVSVTSTSEEKLANDIISAVCRLLRAGS